MEQTYVMVKPDGVQRQIVGRIIDRFEQKGLKLVKAELQRVSRDKAQLHYEELKDKPFFPELVDFITSGDVFAMVWAGPNAVRVARKLIGVTNPADAEPGTIRGDFALEVSSNVIHGSDSVKNAQREISIFFPSLAAEQPVQYSSLNL